MPLKEVEYDFQDNDIEEVAVGSDYVQVQLVGYPPVTLEKAELIVICKEVGLTVTDAEFP